MALWSETEHIFVMLILKVRKLSIAHVNFRWLYSAKQKNASTVQGEAESMLSPLLAG